MVTTKLRLDLQIWCVRILRGHHMGIDQCRTFFDGGGRLFHRYSGIAGLRTMSMAGADTEDGEQVVHEGR